MFTNGAADIGCRLSCLQAHGYTWSKDPETGIYQYIQGTNIINYAISFSNGDNRMTWKDQTNGASTVWDRVVDTNLETTEQFLRFL